MGTVGNKGIDVRLNNSGGFHNGGIKAPLKVHPQNMRLAGKKGLRRCSLCLGISTEKIEVFIRKRNGDRGHGKTMPLPLPGGKVRASSAGPTDFKNPFSLPKSTTIYILSCKPFLGLIVGDDPHAKNRVERCV